MMSKYKTPAILALNCGDASAIRFIMTAVLIIASPYAGNSNQG